mmetsp:Transcript_29494/g.44654  ORF Transcript_29494/g.44654 Transcript_29494/m.44654 type:complete len:126 (+) Transcript_29494:407-784(+)|eukprot:CAMPEP_0178932616 /NCGR_PEP_ID=MMETSP0786-20121207/22739_1 /TAXON_ID=186022 /ORGANISM="Thalassionema frauenfeldii, Strain CCMP 1798" /LENGTH=125 /DNA_ID=CAMNT_0020609973 /DNA_START=308 /DNA_END=685 /DNA_ORIENTATION=+
MLLLGADDPEIRSDFSPFGHVESKTRCRSVEGDDRHLSLWSTVCEWYYEFTMKNLKRFKRSERGRASSKAESPFFENEELLIKFKQWARTDLEHFNVEKAQSFINEKLLGSWTAEELKNNKIAFH